MKKIKLTRTEYYDLLFINEDLLYIILTFLIPLDKYVHEFIIETRKHCQLMEKIANINSVFYNVIINCKYKFKYYFPTTLKLHNVISIVGSLNDIAEVNLDLFPNITEICLTTLEFNKKYRQEKCFINFSLFRLLERIIEHRNIKYVVYSTNKTTNGRLKKLQRYMSLCGYKSFKIIGIK